MAKKKLLGDKLRTPHTKKKPIDLDAVELVGKKQEEPRKTTPLVSPVQSTPKTSNKSNSSPRTKKKPEPMVEEEQEMHRTSFNFPFEVYEAMRFHSFKQRTTMTDYIISLIKKDLKIK